MSNTAKKKKADLKVVIVGEASIGKTCLIRRYIEGTFDPDTSTTLGASFYLKQWGNYNVALWDTAGEERFSGLSSFYCRGASAAILAFDPCSQQSFQALRERFVPLLEAAEKDCLHVVVATKADLVSPSTRAVSSQQVLAFAREINQHLPPKDDKPVIPYFETSSLSGQNVKRLFEYIFEHCLPEGEERKKRTSSSVDLDLENVSSAENKKSCCKT
ncbi:ras-related protein Rab-20 [Lingula anatina]|uniref:Ras-related protein Rab-20 n=1 Tax=Lingula anatina TaxID=7574 RepID=A0A1S3HG12_LINAN|nr:ras-related protein Rab-20 [Lingula anatina]|eukprot:XP_013384995.1 ras-related protein Rab-20 [Lingula anatina]